MRKIERKHYDEKFPSDAVELLITSGKTATSVARDLGISDVTLGSWKKK